MRWKTIQLSLVATLWGGCLPIFGDMDLDKPDDWGDPLTDDGDASDEYENGTPIDPTRTLEMPAFPGQGSLVYGGDPLAVTPIRPSVAFSHLGPGYAFVDGALGFAQAVESLPFGLDYMADASLRRFTLGLGADGMYDPPFSGSENEVARLMLDGAEDMSGPGPVVGITRPPAQRILEQTIDMGIDLGVSHFMFDDASLMEPPYSFDDYTMDGFSSWLVEHVNAADRRDVLGVDNTSMFDFRDWLADQGVSSEAMMELVREEPMMWAFEAYLLDTQRQLFSALTDRVADGFPAMLGTATFDQGLDADVALANVVSAPMASTYNADYPYSQRLAPYYQVHAATGDAMFSWTSPWVAQSGVGPTSMFDVPATLTLFGVEALVHGGGFVFPSTLDRMADSMTWWDKGDVSVVMTALQQRMYDVYWLAANHLDQYRAEPEARAALLYSLEEGTRAQEGFMAGAMILEALHVQHEPLVVGGGLRSPNDRLLSLDRLSPYGLVVITDTRRIPASARAALLDWVEAGGTIMAIGEAIGYADTWGRPHGDATWASLFQAGGGVHMHGLGKVLAVPMATYLGADETMRRALHDAINLSMDLTPYRLVSSDLPRKVAIHVSKDVDGSRIVHLLNYDYDADNDLFEPTSGTLTLDLPDFHGDPVATRLRLGYEPDEVPLVLRDERLHIDVDDLGIYTAFRVGSRLR